MDDPSNRDPWIIAGAILLAAVLIVGTLLIFRAQDKDQRCEELRAKVAYPDDSGSLFRDVAEMNDSGC